QVAPSNTNKLELAPTRAIRSIIIELSFSDSDDFLILRAPGFEVNVCPRNYLVRGIYRVVKRAASVRRIGNRDFEPVVRQRIRKSREYPHAGNRSFGNGVHHIPRPVVPMFGVAHPRSGE